MKFFLLFFLLTPSVWAIEYGELQRYLQVHPFQYDLSLCAIQGKQADAEVMLCCHGAGGTESIASLLSSYNIIPDHLIGFRFPDSGEEAYARSPYETCCGSIEELLPLLYLMKTLVVEAKISSLNLYGFSAGGGAVVNALAVLATERYPEKLQQIGIGTDERYLILGAVQKGWVILETPLKSIDEIQEMRKPNESIDVLAARYSQNNLRPIDSLKQLSNLKLNVLLYFQNPDEVICNRDDALYIERLTEANAAGNTFVVIDDDGGHSAFHAALWQTYLNVIHSN